MDDEIDDIVGDVQYTESQKSVATSNQYSPDFTENSSSSISDKNNSLSGKETYIIEWDSEDSDKTMQLNESQSFIHLSDAPACHQKDAPGCPQKDMPYQQKNVSAYDQKDAPVYHQKDVTVYHQKHKPVLYPQKDVLVYHQKHKPVYPQKDGSVCHQKHLPVPPQKDMPAYPQQDVQVYHATVKVNANMQYKPSTVDNSVGSSVHKCTLVAQETFTQTSKTIIELAENEGTVCRVADKKSLETQTSFISVTENKTVEYRIEVSSAHSNYTKAEIITCNNELTKKPAYYNITCNQILSDSLGDGSSKFPLSETDEVNENSIASTNDKVIKIINDGSNDNFESEYNANDLNCENTSEITDSDIEADSLMGSTSENPKSPNSDVKDLHCKLNGSQDVEIEVPDTFGDPDIRRFGTLTPLTEESAMKKDSLVDVTPANNFVDVIKEKEDELLFTNKAGMKVKLLKENMKSKESFRLPPIQNQSCPNSPHLNSLFTTNKSNRLNKAGTLPCLYEGGRPKDNMPDRWEIGSKELASGEGALINGRSGDARRTSPVQLPPIHAECHANSNVNSTRPQSHSPVNSRTASANPLNPHPRDQHQRDTLHDAISIKDKIKELKMSTKTVRSYNHSNAKFNVSRSESRSNSPGSTSSPEESRLNEVADRGCDTLCLELLRKLRSTSWFEVMETLDELPKSMLKFWGVISEQRIADLLRQVNAHIESPRPQVARSACNTVAAILKNTNYTKKPDFYETITILLIKTGSYSRPLRRAANVALDDIVCGVDTSHAVTALCIHGTTHKNALVRCAAARLLVVCCALAGGGRELLRARPPSAAAARRHALRALAALLDDKSTDARKYAERLYSMLRPLTNFEAYYLTDVDVELASRHMKKYDQLLLCGPPKEAR